MQALTATVIAITHYEKITIKLEQLIKL